MKINYNISAMIANNALAQNDKALSRSIERLSSGLKINSAKDNASGIAMAKRMNAQLRGIETAGQNSEDGISVIQIAEGALSEVQDMLQRMSELSVKAANGTLTDEERSMINDEIDQLKSEIERISETTMYNGEILLNGDFDLKGYTDTANVKVVTYSDNVRSGNYVIDSLTTVFDADGKLDPAQCSITLGSEFPVGATATFSEDAVYITGSNGFSMELQIARETALNGASVTVEATGLGTMGLQVGTNSGQELDVRIAQINLRALGIKNGDVLNQKNAQQFISQVSNALSYVSQARSRLGAYENRLEYTVGSLDVSEENMTSAYSRIMDVDMAEEMTYYSTYQVLVQAGTSMLAQANERPASVLSLLQN